MDIKMQVVDPELQESNIACNYSWQNLKSNS